MLLLDATRKKRGEKLRHVIPQRCHDRSIYDVYVHTYVRLHIYIYVLSNRFLWKHRPVVLTLEEQLFRNIFASEFLFYNFETHILLEKFLWLCILKMVAIFSSERAHFSRAIVQKKNISGFTRCDCFFFFFFFFFFFEVLLNSVRMLKLNYYLMQVQMIF